MRHPNHVCWLNHTMREYYDLWPRFSARSAPRARMKERVRRALIHRGRPLSAHAQRPQAVRAVAHDPAAACDLAGTARRPCCTRRRRSVRIAARARGDYVFMVSRLTPLKRADLLLEALAQPEAAGIHAVIAGDGEERPRLEALSRRARARRLASPSPAGFTDEQLLDHLARCRAVCFPPLDEDYGFVTAEAFARARPWSRAGTAAGRPNWSRTVSPVSSRAPSPGALRAQALASSDDG